MDFNSVFPGYDDFSNFDDPFGASNTYVDNNNQQFTTFSTHVYPTAANTMAGNSYPPVTPSSHQGAHRTYPAMPAGVITPYSQQYGRSNSNAYADHAMQMQQRTPMSPHFYDGAASSIAHAPPQAAPTFLTYNGNDKSFSDNSSDGFAVASTPTPKARGMPTPTQSPQSSNSNLPSIPLSQLQYDNFDEAEAEASGRTPLTVQNDDWMFVEANKQMHVATIMAAFDTPFRPEPNVPITVTEKIRWVKYQTEQTDKTAKYLAKNPKAKELAAWLLLEALLDVHKLGYKKDLRLSDPDTRCTSRFYSVSASISPSTSTQY